jgi:hypothetical protein
MPPPQKRNPIGPRSSRDHTSLVVGLGLGLLAVVGVLTIFADPIWALVSPPAPDHGAPPAEASRPAPADAGADS